MRKLFLFVSFLALLTSLNAAATTVLTCIQANDPTKEMLVLSSDEKTNFTLEIIDPAALQPLAHLKLWPNTVSQASRIISVDHWESFVGAVQLIAVFDAGAFKSKHVYFDASFGLDKDNRGSYGMQKFNQLAAAGIQWTCEEGPL